MELFMLPVGGVEERRERVGRQGGGGEGEREE